MSIVDSFKRLLGRERRAPATRQNGDGAAAAPARSRVTYNCKLCGVASTVRGVVYDHLKQAHSEIVDRNGHINEHREDEAPRAHA